MTSDGALSGCRVLVCRAATASAELLSSLTALGAEAVAHPLIEIAPASDQRALIDSAARWKRGEYGWLVVTSSNGVDAFMHAVGRMPSGEERPSKVAAVGPATAAALRRWGVSVDLVPERDYSGRGLAQALLSELRGSARPMSAVLPLSNLASDTVQQALEAVGHRVYRVDAYRTVPNGQTVRTLLEHTRFDAVLLFSASGAAELARHISVVPQETRLIAIGAPTAAALEARGVRVDAIAKRHTSQGLIDAVVGLLGRSSDPPSPDSKPSGKPATLTTRYSIEEGTP